jgi:hypothetical protein
MGYCLVGNRGDRVEVMSRPIQYCVVGKEATYETMLVKCIYIFWGKCSTRAFVYCSAMKLQCMLPDAICHDSMDQAPSA